MGRPLDAPIEIAPRITAEKWQKLNLDAPDSRDWNDAIKIFEKRIRGRFLDPAKKITCLPFGGFAVMALDCLLIETLQQFKRGVHETRQDPDRGSSKKYFIDFLTDKDMGLGEHFDKELAELFYTHIRCGILHQAEIKGKSRLRIKLETLVQKAPDRTGIVIDRKKFHQALVNVFKRYVEQLRNPSNAELRQNFRKKMDAIVNEVQ